MLEVKSFFEVFEKTSTSFFLVGGIPRDYIAFLQTKNITPQTLSKNLFKIDVSYFWNFLETNIQRENHKKCYLDFDLSTTEQPKDIAHILDKIIKEHFPLIKRFRQFATHSIELNNAKIEITTTRIDKECDGKHAKMKFGASYFRDSFRRDFTFNAIYMDFNGNVFDFHNGIEHLLNGEIHFIGDAKTRILEDFTRIKRYRNFVERFKMINPEIEKEIDYITQNSTTPIIMR